MRPWYNFLRSTISTLLVGIFGIIVLVVFVLWFHKFIQSLFNIEFNIENNEFIPYVGHITLILVIIFIYPAIRVYNYFFPSGIFAIGQGASRFDFQQKLLKWIVGTVPILGILKLIFG